MKSWKPVTLMQMRKIWMQKSMRRTVSWRRKAMAALQSRK